jgi:CRP-like cAMP-binding protein
MITPETLRDLSFLHDVADEDLKHLAAMAEARELPAEAVVFREGDTPLHIYLVSEGRVALDIRAPRGLVRIHTVGPGELLGWSTLLDSGPMTAGARTLSPCRLIALHAMQVRALCEHNPRLGLEFMRRVALALARRLSATRLQLLDVYRNELPVVAEHGDAT